MSFVTDKQTLDDLNLLGKFKPHSLFSIFNKVHTTGGERLLEQMFQQPLTRHQAINQRAAIFRYYQQRNIQFPLAKQLFTAVENYQTTAVTGALPVTIITIWTGKLMKAVIRSQEYDRIANGVQATITMLEAVFTLYKQLAAANDYPHQSQLNTLRLFFDHKEIQRLLQSANSLTLPATTLATYHYLLRHEFRKEIEQLLQIVYEIDVYIAVAKVARERSLYYAQALPAAENVFRTTALSHPGIDKAVANPLTFDTGSNLLFLTGANMAGKSTLMKSFGIAVYMAHMGFPVAARELVFSVRDGLYTSINVPDNLNLGYSHYYAEVLRVKNVAEEVASGKKLVVIFDELFKGTNVKDAYDATLAVTEAFSDYRSCFFIISTHIIEAGDALKTYGSHISFQYMPTIMNVTKPIYTYQLTPGITNDRQGMLIIENEGILAELRQSQISDVRSQI